VKNEVGRFCFICALFPSNFRELVYTKSVMEDVIIIGAGVVGGFIARSLSRYELSVLVLEKENDVGDVTSMANSAIAHSGYDPEPGSKKAKFNVLGNRMMPKVCQELDVPFGKVGTLTIALEEEQLATLKDLLGKSQNQRRRGTNFER
jgi:glycerol-3-phosphate dehydrogenase